MNLKEYMRTMSSEPFQATLWRDFFAELVGTFALVAVQCMLPLKHGSNNFGGPVETGLGMGFVVCSMAWCVGDFSGGHLNPAVSFAMAVSLKITIFRAMLYMIAQCVGAFLGAGLVYLVTPSNVRDGLATTTLQGDVTPLQGFVVEILITFMLVATIFGATNSARKKDLYMPTIPIGFAVAMGVMCGFAYTGGSMNPARSFGPAIVMGIWSHHWIYWLGPFIGGALAALVYGMLDRIGTNAIEPSVTISDLQTTKDDNTQI